jgi:hypothetical protein
MPTPLDYGLNKRITVERNTPTKNSTGGDVPSWAAISAATTNIKARDIQKRHWDKTQEFGGRADWSAEVEWVTNVDCGAKPGDRVNHGGVYYEIVGQFDFGHDAISSDTVYVMKTLRLRTTA